MGQDALNEPMRVNELGDEAYFKESVQILGLSHGELADFINPANSSQQKSQQQQYQGAKSAVSVSSSGAKYKRDESNAHLLDKLEVMEQMPDNLNQQIDEIGEYCVQLIADLSNS